MERAICWQCGKPATQTLPYYIGGRGWVDVPVCELGDAHPGDVWEPVEQPALAEVA